MFNIGPLELIVVLIIALIVLGPQRLPDAARSVGRGIREFRGALNMEHDDEDDWEPPAAPQVERVDSPEQAAAAKPHTTADEPQKPGGAESQPAAAAEPQRPASS